MEKINSINQVSGCSFKQNYNQVQNTTSPIECQNQTEVMSKQAADALRAQATTQMMHNDNMQQQLMQQQLIQQQQQNELIQRQMLEEQNRQTEMINQQNMQQLNAMAQQAAMPPMGMGF